MSMGNLSPELRGYIHELQSQVSMFSDRAAGLSGELAAARQQIEMLKGQIEGLKKVSQEAQSTGDEDAGKT